MPKINSKWILFLEEKRDKKLFVTYRESYGRWEATEKDIKEIEKSLKK